MKTLPANKAQPSSNLLDQVDMIIIGGGITGAGIFHAAGQLGLKALLVEQADFAWGTSSRSSKLVHGGLRYLKEGRLLLTRDAVRERERLLGHAPGLVTPMPFWVPVYKDRGPGRWTLEAGLSVYDLIAKKRRHRFCPADELCRHLPHIDRRDLEGGFEFFDAQVDDARLVLRLIFEGRLAGGTALNYTRTEAIRRDEQGRVSGVLLQDVETRQTFTVAAGTIVNATGCWAEQLHPRPGAHRHLRPLRGSHLIFPATAIPAAQAISFMHPRDRRAVFVIPWEGAVLVGTTDLDHHQPLSAEPAITEQEVDYLMDGLRALFPSLGLRAGQCLATIAGVRPVLSDGKRPPSEESREHAVWVDQGLVTVTGGKLTTYRKLAVDTIKACQPFLDHDIDIDAITGRLSSPPARPDKAGALESDVWHRLTGRYGTAAVQLVAEAAPEDLATIGDTHTLWAELIHAARHENIRHLDDLLLRRARVGLLLPSGGLDILPRIRHPVMAALDWDNRRWHTEVRRYKRQWKASYALPTGDKKPIHLAVDRGRRWFRQLRQRVGHRVSA